MNSDALDLDRLMVGPPYWVAASMYRGTLTNNTEHRWGDEARRLLEVGGRYCLEMNDGRILTPDMDGHLERP